MRVIQSFFIACLTLIIMPAHCQHPDYYKLLEEPFLKFTYLNEAEATGMIRELNLRTDPSYSKNQYLTYFLENGEFMVKLDQNNKYIRIKNKDYLSHFVHNEPLERTISYSYFTHLDKEFQFVEVRSRRYIDSLLDTFKPEQLKTAHYQPMWLKDANSAEVYLLTNNHLLEMKYYNEEDALAYLFPAEETLVNYYKPRGPQFAASFEKDFPLKLEEHKKELASTLKIDGSALNFSAESIELVAQKCYQYTQCGALDKLAEPITAYLILCLQANVNGTAVVLMKEYTVEESIYYSPVVITADGRKLEISRIVFKAINEMSDYEYFPYYYFQMKKMNFY